MIAYAELMQVDDRPKPRPKCHPTIPSAFLGHMLEIENWLLSFGKVIKSLFPSSKVPSNCRKEALYQSFQQ